MLLLVRRREWWRAKVPLSILLLFLLIDGQPLTLAAVVALLGLVATVCCAANYGYALNELFDRQEDRRSGQDNVTNTTSGRGIWSIIILSATGALGFAAVSAGLLGTVLTGGVLLLPLAYSVPPLRLKARGWFGIIADALAAHVYPALLALAIVSFHDIRSISLVLVLTVGLWSLATGLRGIISHQLTTEARDLRAGLTTVVHRLGHGRIMSFVVFAILPIEIISFSAVLLQSLTHVSFFLIVGIFAVWEFLKFSLNALPQKIFTPKGCRYIPFVDDTFYKVWGPLALLVDAAFTDVRYLLLAPVFVFLFRPRINRELKQIRATAETLQKRVVNFVK